MCNPDGYIQLTVVPQGNYTYQWDNGANPTLSYRPRGSGFTQ
ncbi:MAG: hypothetical protein R2788_12850 [Saprospiraceae bacterium]